MEELFTIGDIIDGKVQKADKKEKQYFQVADRQTVRTTAIMACQTTRVVSMIYIDFEKQTQRQLRIKVQWLRMTCWTMMICHRVKVPKTHFDFIDDHNVR